ncbi:hypothetical protein TWF679_000129 [Orbilia oligospora]|uniref:Nucleoside phosphorylase domain-containing protein n=1 Tax=Orbilia oligospora TaxID=2813651 RepID=A0A8H8VN54_ORBOL|nr:hypothetical protein TWF679_000129 [Orbilia oligospora]
MPVDPAIPVDPKLREEYTIGWICALPKEQIAAVPMLDQRHPDPKLYKSPNDTNAYFFGSIGPHNVVITCLPLKCYGTNRTAKAAAQMLNNFPSIKITFMVGIGAGIPTKVKLGDVVVGTEWAQWDFGKANVNGVFEHTGRKCFPPDELLSVMSKIRTEHSLRGYSQIPEYIRSLGTEFPHLTSEYCLRPDAPKGWRSTLVESHEDVKIHYGLIASGNQVVKDAKVREDINNRLEGQVLCLEMEAAGLVGIPAVVIRGICDYADLNKNDDWQGYAAAIAAACAKEFINSIEPATAREIQVRREDFNRVAISEIAVLRGSLAGDKERKILEWITPIDDSAQHNDFLNRRQPGTGSWLLNSSEYQNWLHTPKAILYCPGIPGAGKTILTSVVVDDLLDRYSYDPGIGIAYIYFNFKGSAHLRIDDLLLNLLKQLVRTQDSLPEYTKQLYDRYKGGGRPSRAEVMNSINAISAAYSRIFIVIDALDEYEDHSEFLEKVFEVYELQQLNIFTTSRPIPGIKDKFKEKENCTECEIRASDEDVRQYLEGQILRLGTNAVKSNKEIIKNGIVKLVQGMFLLAHLYFQAIKAAKTLKAIKQILSSFSGGRGPSNSAYDSTYSAIMEKIRANDEELVPITFKVLMWITCASRRLTKAELQHAIAVEPEEPTEIDNDNISDIEDLISPCLGLVTIDEESNVVRLIHYTAQEYLERTKQSWFSNPHNYLATTCITYLSYDNFKLGICSDEDDLKERLRSNSLYRYAANNFAYHIRESSPGQTETLSLVLDFLLEDNLLLACVQVSFNGRLWYGIQSRDAMASLRALHVAAYFGLARAVELLLAERRTDLETKEGYNGRTPLSVAAGRGHKDVVGLLIKEGANMETKDKNGDTVLSVAAAGGHKDVVELLIKEGANLENKNRNGKTPLWSAVSNRRETITRLLIEAKGDISVKDYDGKTLISFAAGRRDKGILLLLIERVMDAELEEMYYETACAAAQYGYEDIMKRLIERGVNLGPATWYRLRGWFAGLTPLWHAIKARQEGVARLIVNAGANVEEEYNFEKPIFFALRNGYDDFVRILAGRANLEVEEKEINTPLSVAISNRQRGCVELLLGNGALVKPNALSEALRNKDEDMIKLLLGAMQNPNAARDAWNGTLLMAAVFYGHESTIKFLIQKGADIQARDMNGETPLSIAIRKAYNAVGRLPDVDIGEGASSDDESEDDECELLVAARRREEVVRLLLENVEDVYEATDLMWYTMSRGGGDIARLLIGKVASLEGDDRRRTALLCAAANGNGDIVRTLVRAGIDLELKNNAGATPLMAAIYFNYKGIAEFLIVNGASLETRTEYGETPLSIAALGGREEIVQLLIHHKANLEAKDDNIQTPLSIAAKNGCESTVRLLVEKGADWRTVDEDGNTPLSLARKNEHESIAQFLMDISREVKA